MFDEAESLRSFFIEKALVRLSQVLPKSPEMTAHLRRRVQGLAERAQFEHVEEIYVEGADHSKAWIARKRRDAKKRLRAFIERAVARFRAQPVPSRAAFDVVWRSLADKLAEYCRKFFDWIDPGVHCEALGEDST